MNDYPAGSLDHNVPLLFVSGLSSGATTSTQFDASLKERSILIRSEASPVEGRPAKSILHYIQENDATNVPWNSLEDAKYKFKVRTVGREFLLPPRRVPPQGNETPVSPTILHSPFSPLTPGSTLYADGLIDSQWNLKHQEHVPSICLYFYSLTTDSTLATLRDNQLKTDVNAVKNALIRSGYKTRLVVVILCDESPTGMNDYQERLENIRRGTGLDPKASLFVLPTQRSEADLESAVDSVLSPCYAQALEYYRDLGRHARRKKGRGTVPQPTVPPTNSSHTLTLQGWNIRYDYKAAIFAEFRQEMDNSLRSYEQAYENLIGPEVLEAIPSWSARAREARILADSIATRIIRCLLWTSQSTAAVRRWQSHRDRIAEYVERFGSGTKNYGWKAWEARWMTIMAGLVDKTGYPEFKPDTKLYFRPPEKNLSADRLQPWELLHHPGYWYRGAAQHLLDRRKLARTIPDGARTAPSDPDASQPQTKSYTYDTYLCPEPYEEYPLTGQGVDHAQLIVDQLSLARTEFQKRQQVRFAAEIALECAKELESMKAWKQLLELITPIWRDASFRTEGWWDILESLSWSLRAAAAQLGQAELIVAIDWELLNQNLGRRPGWTYDMAKSLEGVSVDTPPTIALGDEHISCFLAAAFVFSQDEGKAGQTCLAQLSITSNAFSGSPPLVINFINVVFEGSVRTITLGHTTNQEDSSSAADQKVVITSPSLVENEVADEDRDDEETEEEEESKAIVLKGSADLTISPGQIRVFQIQVPLREPGDAKASSVEISYAPGPFSLRYSLKIPETNPTAAWYFPSAKKKVARKTPQGIHILPRPPKMDIKPLSLLDQYYSNEPIELEFELTNNEDSDASTKLEVNVFASDIRFAVRVEDGDARPSVTVAEEDASKVVGLSVGTIGAGKSARAFIRLEPINEFITYEVNVKAWYHLVSDPATSIIQEHAFQLKIVTPFEANYDLLPRHHTEAWPSLFDHDSILDSSNDNQQHVGRPQGLAQKWCLVTRFASFALEDLLIKDVEVLILATQGGVTCVASNDTNIDKDGLMISPKVIEEARFDLVAHKHSLDDRSPSTADMAFVIKWRRTDAANKDEFNITTISLPRFYVTVSEPRVLATVSYSTDAATGGSTATGAPLIFLDVTVENPSSHFLTFGLTMDPSDEFAFSGSKTTTMNVLPVARRSVTYRLLPLTGGGKWIRPTLVVRDKYFQKVLKIIPTEGMKNDRDGVLIWVPPEEGVVAATEAQDAGEK